MSILIEISGVMSLIFGIVALIKSEVISRKSKPLALKDSPCLWGGLALVCLSCISFLGCANCFNYPQSESLALYLAISGVMYTALAIIVLTEPTRKTYN